MLQDASMSDSHRAWQVLLSGPPAGADEVTDLKREAAYNLSLIYRESGSHHLARSLLVTYCTF